MARDLAAALAGDRGRAGLAAGVLVGRPGGRWRGHLRARAVEFALGDPHRLLGVTLEQTLRVGRASALELRFGAERDFDRTVLESGVFLRRWF